MHLCIYVCVCVYMYVCINLCVYICICVCIYCCDLRSIWMSCECGCVLQRVVRVLTGHKICLRVQQGSHVLACM